MRTANEVIMKETQTESSKMVNHQGGNLNVIIITPGNLDCLNKMLNRKKVNGSFRLRQSRAFEA